MINIRDLELSYQNTYVGMLKSVMIIMYLDMCLGFINLSFKRHLVLRGQQPLLLQLILKTLQLFLRR